MSLTPENIVLLGSILLFISIIASKTSFKIGVPTLILFLVVGMLAGSEGLGGINFDEPKTAQFLGVIALNFILFSGGLDTKWESIKPIIKPGITLSTLGVLITAISVGVFASWLLEIRLVEGLLLGAIVSSTDAAAVFSILRSRAVGLKGNLRPLLELESGSNDPMAFFLTVSLTFLVANSEASILSLVPMFFKQMILGAVAGYLMGKLMIWVVNKINLDFEGLYPVLIISMMFFTFSATDFAGGNGFLAVYLAGVALGNTNFIHKKSMLKFYDGIAWLMQIVMFLTLGLLVFPSKILPIMGFGLILSLFLIVIARPLAVYISLSFFKFNNRKKLFISWVGLRGAVPIVFATYPLIAGVDYADTIFNLVFFISVSSVLLQGTTLSLVAKWLHVSVPASIRRKFPLDLEMSESVKSQMKEFDVDQGALCIGKSIVNLGFPKEALIVLINRNGKFITPNGATVIELGDHLLVMFEGEATQLGIEQVLGNPKMVL